MLSPNSFERNELYSIYYTIPSIYNTDGSDCNLYIKFSNRTSYCYL